MGVVQYSLDGGRQWLSIDDPGSRFDQGGYNGDLDGTAGNPLAGTAGWSGQSAGFASGFDSVSLDLTELAEPGTMLADRKSTRLNSSHVAISYAVFCLK